MEYKATNKEDGGFDIQTNLQSLESLKQHKEYVRYILTPGSMATPSLTDVKNYLKDAYLGLVPIPLNTENLSKSYAYFGGAYHRQTVQKILSKKELALNLIPALNNIEKNGGFNFEAFRNDVCEKEAVKNKEELNRLIQLNGQRARIALEETFKNPTVAANALKAMSKKQWGQLLVKPPKNKHLLKAAAKLSSEEFFKNGMQLAFLEIEPEIYGVLKESPRFRYRGFKAQQYLRIFLELRQSLKALTEKQLSEKEYKLKDKTEATITKEPASQPAKEKTSIVEKIVREELGHDIPINYLQVQKILAAADAILKETPAEERPIDFLHNSHPEFIEEKITFDTMDLSNRS